MQETISGRGTWMGYECRHTFKASEDAPTDCPICHFKEQGFGAVYAESRVHGDHYEYYDGGSDWVKSANANMNSAAAYNFQSKA